ncbi:MAG TPA: hypothetical protein VNS58_02485 [Puia sp.]|nr:hypothetical protein [Puia sp.]
MKSNLFVTLLIITATSILGIYSCKKTSSYSTMQPSDFTPTRAGQYIIYRLDSTIFVNFGTQQQTVSYLVKDVVDASVTDNLGRPGWRIFRYISDTALSSGWSPFETYLVTPTRQNVEALENNLRFIKLTLPITNNFSWPGNTYLPDNPLGNLFDFSDPEHSNWASWNYTYQDVNTSNTYNGKTYDSTVTVLQIDDSTSKPLFGSRTYWKEKYAPHLGLIYKEVKMWEYQASYTVSNCYYVNCTKPVCDTVDCTLNPNNCTLISQLPIDQLQNWTEHCRDSVLTGFYHIGYGVKMTIVDHN